MRKRLKLSFDRLEDTLTLVSPLEASSLFGGYSEGSGLPPDASVDDILGYYSGLGFTFSQDEDGNYMMTGGGTYSGPGIKLDPVTVTGNPNATSDDSQYGVSLTAMIERFLEDRGRGSDTGQDDGSTGSDGSTVPDNGYEGPWGGTGTGGGTNTGGTSAQIRLTEDQIIALIAEMSNIMYAKNYAIEYEGLSAGEAIAQALGGNVLISYNADPSNWQNTCALSLSQALNKAGGANKITQTSGTVAGDVNRDGVSERYFYSAETMYNYLSEKYGKSNRSNISNIGTSTANIPEGAKGFVFFKNVNMGAEGSQYNYNFNHIDFWDGSKTASGSGGNYSGQNFDGKLDMYFIRVN